MVRPLPSDGVVVSVWIIVAVGGGGGDAEEEDSVELVWIMITGMMMVTLLFLLGCRR